MDDSVKKCFQMISIVGEVKANYIQSIQMAKNNQFDQAKELLKAGDHMFHEIYDLQQSLSQKHMGQILNDYQLLLMHTQDQVMSTEQFKMMAIEMQDCYRKIHDLEKRIENRGEL